MSARLEEIPPDLPVPSDDGAASHLVGAEIADLHLPCTDGTQQSLRTLARPTVLFFYPRTGIPGQPPSLGFLGETWESIPGARGCTPQCLGFGRLASAFRQSTAFQREFQERQSLDFEFLSDSELLLTHAMRLPTFEFPIESGGPNTLLRRMAWVVANGRIVQLWYPVFPPGECAANVLAWLREQRANVTRDS